MSPIKYIGILALFYPLRGECTSLRVLFCIAGLSQTPWCNAWRLP